MQDFNHVHLDVAIARHRPSQVDKGWLAQQAEILFLSKLP
jgi:hypothetical protein